MFMSTGKKQQELVAFLTEVVPAMSMDYVAPATELLSSKHTVRPPSLPPLSLSKFALPRFNRRLRSPGTTSFQSKVSGRSRLPSVGERAASHCL